MSSLIDQPLPNPGPLTEAQRHLIKSTAPLLAEHGTKITGHMYKQMLTDNPELQNIFSRSKQDVSLLAPSCNE
jgi:nitric oxide dioxygenase